MCIHKLDENIWCIDGDPVTMWMTPFQTRMTVIRLADNKLWLHSPVAPSPERIEAVNKLGELAYLIAPNILHHLYLDKWAALYPNAKLWGAQGLPKKRKDLQFNGVLDNNQAEPEWQAEIEQLYFEGSKILPEMVFFHKASKSLIVTDLIQNHDPQHENAFWKVVKKLNGVLAPNGGVAKDLRLTMLGREKARASLDKMLTWDFDKLVISHGLCIESDAKDYVSNCFSWLK